MVEIDSVGAFGTGVLFRLRPDEFIAQAIGQSRHDLILELEQVGDVFLEAVGPKMRAGARIDELGVDAHPVLVALHRAFQHIAHAELPADLPGVDVLALEAEGGIAGDHEAIVDARQIGRQILRDAVREIILARVVREIGEGEDDDRKPRGLAGVRLSTRRSLCGWR